MEFRTEKAYFDYVSRVDEYLISQARPKVTSKSKVDQELLIKWVTQLTVETIKSELLILSRGRASSHPLLKLSPSPVRLEFLCSLLIKHRNPSAIVIANYSRDDEGLPISHAPGNNSDIELHLGKFLELYEVTLTTGASQAKAEFAPITRHLDDQISAKVYPKENIQTILVAPVIHSDFITWIDFAKFKYQKRMAALSIPDFVNLD
jgi:hypothetical protein